MRSDLLSMDFGKFDFLPVQENNVLFAIDSLSLEGLQAMVPGNVGASLPSPTWLESGVFLLFTLCFVLFSLVFRNAQGSFIGNFKTNLSLRKSPVPGHKVQVTTAELWGEFFMIFQTVVMTAVFLFVLFADQGYALDTPTAYLRTFGAILLGLSVIAGLKYLMYRSISSFFMTADIKRWVAQYYRHFQLLGIFLFLPMLFFVFLQEYRDIMLIVVLFLFFINRLVVIIGILNIFVKNKVGLICFLSYLCGTEIAPYLLFYKGAVSIVNIAGNYLV